MNVTLVWDEDDDPRGNVAMIRLLGLTKEDIEYVFSHGATDPDVSNMAGWPTLFGDAEDGRFVAVIYKWERPGTVYVIDVKVGA